MYCGYLMNHNQHWSGDIFFVSMSENLHISEASVSMVANEAPAEAPTKPNRIKE